MHKSRKLTEEDLFGHQVSKNQVTHSPVNDLQKYNNVLFILSFIMLSIHKILFLKTFSNSIESNALIHNIN